MRYGSCMKVSGLNCTNTQSRKVDNGDAILSIFDIQGWGPHNGTRPKDDGQRIGDDTFHGAWLRQGES